MPGWSMSGSWLGHAHHHVWIMTGLCLDVRLAFARIENELFSKSVAKAHAPDRLFITRGSAAPMQAHTPQWRILASLKMKNCTRDRGDVIIAFIYDA